MPVNYLLLDIEGTTTPISFVKEVLFPYAEKHITQFVHNHMDDPVVESCIEQVKETATEEDGRIYGTERAVNKLVDWIQEDRKHPALKTIQGRLWRQGYETGEFTAPVYDDVPECLERWQTEGYSFAVFSSGSVEAQKLLFGHTNAGDLTPYFSHYFDTKMGSKKEPSAYKEILASVGSDGAEMLFLSDVAAELDAASQAGVHTLQVVRPGTEAAGSHPTAASFQEVDSWLKGS